MGITITAAGAFRETGASFFFPRRAHLLTTCEAGGGIPPSGRAVRSARRIALSAESASQCRRACGRRASLPVRRNCVPFLRLQQTCNQQLYRSYGRMLPRTVHFLLPRQKKQNRPLQGQKGRD